MIMEWIQLIAGGIIILAGIFFMVSSVVGNYRFRFVLSRMQAAAMADTMGIFLVLIGLAILAGFQISSLKLLIVVVFHWLSSPVASHLLVLLELSVHENVKKEIEVGE